MKRNAKALWVVCAVLLFGSFAVPQFTGCTTTQKTATYKTLYSVEKSIMASYDAYLDLVVAGKVKTNSVPQVSVAFNTAQRAMQMALAGAQFNTTNPPTAEVIAAAANLAVAIEQAK